MSVNKNSLPYMKEYLKYALEFEKYVYIWSKAMDDANYRMKQIYDNRRRLNSTKRQARNQLDSLDNASKEQRQSKECEAARYRKKAKIALIIGFVFFSVLPICLVVRYVYKNKAENLEEEAKQLTNKNSLRRQEEILQAQESDSENDWVVNVVEESVINKKQEEIQNALIIAKNNLSQIYSENILAPKYRNFTAVATLYEYIDTGRCTTIQGHGGIYDTYETEKIHIEQLRQMVQMNKTLSKIESNQRLICRELMNVNQTLSRISSSLDEIEKTNAEIAKNTAISAIADKQTAAATSWLAWNAWANGY